MAYKNFTETEFIEEIGAEIRKARLAAGLTMSQVLEILDEQGLTLSATMLSRIESGERRIDDELFQAVCTACGANHLDLAIKAGEAHIRRLRERGQFEGLIVSAETSEEDYRINMTDLENVISDLSPEGQRELMQIARMRSYIDLRSGELRRRVEEEKK